MRTDLAIACIALSYNYSGSGKYGWAASLDWIDSKWCQAGCVEGKINTRYTMQTISEAQTLQWIEDTRGWSAPNAAGVMI